MLGNKRYYEIKIPTKYLTHRKNKDVDKFDWKIQAVWYEPIKSDGYAQIDFLLWESALNFEKLVGDCRSESSDNKLEIPAIFKREWVASCHGATTTLKEIAIVLPISRLLFFISLKNELIIILSY